MILFIIIKLVNRFVNDETNINEKIMFYNKSVLNDDKCLSLYLLINVSSLKTLVKITQRGFIAH